MEDINWWYFILGFGGYFIVRSFITAAYQAGFEEGKNPNKTSSILNIGFHDKDGVSYFYNMHNDQFLFQGSQEEFMEWAGARYEHYKRVVFVRME